MTVDPEEHVEWLEELLGDPERFVTLPLPLQRRLLVAAGQLSRPDRAEYRKRRNAERRQHRTRIKDQDRNTLERTVMRAAIRAPVYEAPALAPPGDRESTSVLHEANKCYVCKTAYREVHFFYDQLCGACAALNYEKRFQTANLEGRVALVTGARVKIGFQASLMLLRAGARVIATTRFPVDAAQRYAREADFGEFRDRLSIYGLDLRHTRSVESFSSFLSDREPRLDFVLHNACQTVRRPPNYYAHLINAESDFASLPAQARTVLDDHAALIRGSGRAPNLSRVGSSASAVLSQLELTHEDVTLRTRTDLFPSAELDRDLQQVDLRNQNSWRLRLHEVSIVELLEVHLVNAVAPFVMSARLKPLMLRTPERDKHIVNVSAMEGQFYRSHKTDKHPHTNMAKAALNMLTRTSAQDYVRDGIHMNSVDTGWVTDEDPIDIARRKTAEHGFQPPLDIVDGAARICDPIFSGFRTGEHIWGLFLKDYTSVPW